MTGSRNGGKPHTFATFVPVRELTTGDLEEITARRGQGVGLAGRVETANQLVETMTAEALGMLRRRPGPDTGSHHAL